MLIINLVASTFNLENGGTKLTDNGSCFNLRHLDAFE